MAINTVIHTGAQSIDRVLNAGLPVILVFWKSDVRPALETRLETVAAQNAGKILIAKVDAGNEKSLLDRFNVDRLPTYIFVKNGKTEATAIGQIPESGLDSWVHYLIHGGSRPAVPQGASQPVFEPAFTPAGQYTNGSAPTQRAPRSGTHTSTSATPVTLTDNTFDDIINQPGVTLVDFWAEWCGPCRMVAPVIEQLAEEFQGRARVGKLNVDQNPITAQRYKIMSIPALYIFKNGQVVDQIIGVQSLNVLRQRLASHI